MYYHHFGLTEAPFSIAVDPRYLFMSARHQDALAHLIYGVTTGGGFVLLTGEVGTGKTTVNRSVMARLPETTDVALVLNPALNAEQLLAAVCDELGIACQKDEQNLKSLTDKLHRFLLDNHARGRNTVLLIDEAQHLQLEVLEQIRLLTNLETDNRKLLQIILVGQPELQTLLGRRELRQLSQRITARYQLKPLSPEETAAYIQHRLKVAGLNEGPPLFPPRVMREIHRLSGGIPRLINLLCDRALLGSYGQNKKQVDRAMVRQAASEVLGEERGQQRAPWRWPLLASTLLLFAVALFALFQSPLGTGLRAGIEQTAVSTEGAQVDADLAAGESAVVAEPWYRQPAEAMLGMAAALGIPASAADCSQTSSWRCESVTDQSWEDLQALKTAPEYLPC